MKTVEITKLMCVNKNDLNSLPEQYSNCVVLQLHSYYNNLIQYYRGNMCDTCQKYTHSFLTQQGEVTLIRPVEPFVTGIKTQSTDQESKPARSSHLYKVQSSIKAINLGGDYMGREPDIYTFLRPKTNLFPKIMIGPSF